MSTLARLKAKAADVIAEYFDKSRQAEEARERETKAVITIQAVARGFLARRRIDVLTSVVRTIQRCWRGYLGRLRAKLARETRDKRLRALYFAAKAITIQRHWRGFWSRKHLFNFYARQQYLQTVRQKNAEVRAIVNDEAEQAAALQQQMAEEAAQQLFNSKISKLHHLTSTTAQPGIFNSPYAIATGTVPFVAGLPVEDHLKVALKAGVTERLPPIRKTTRKAKGAADVYPTEVMFNGQKIPPRITLRQVVPYDEVHKAQLLEEKVQHAEMLTLHPLPFMHSLHKPQLPAIDPQSNRNAEQYVTPNDPTVGARNENFSSAMRKVSPTRFNKYGHKKPFFDPILNQEGY
mmetsp:Transcript_6398/g.14233  ORF Transcript_6398/g.14233 Transcript_6398/m.14233 type:complete len:349 (-) Transcript_6398:546-1592(-)|eukprot:CAMPEP_0202902270 /NCGR_PEP_ID=MMETSP1392-20130828/16759_1 /ASSEMBLY_ACC=CAM_ASM_000868 /TAXON_ID=225041 /ORGANISM="Chlamydomonas chlamydogama, Strain SAG 11-48b" /LENGTH=348 /DNA_ID=CAMNT_0049589011 /DNA_START=368 /DNA_END=1414 /DNA_ORIENTATION=-